MAGPPLVLGSKATTMLNRRPVTLLAPVAIEGVPGPLSPQALATQIFGLYVGFVYLMPVFGGLFGDRVLGRRRGVALGALLMTAGHFCMAFEASFLPALLLLIVGAGVLHGNLASQVGDLYSSCRAGWFDLQRTIVAGLPFRGHDRALVRRSACYTAEALLVTDPSKIP